MLIGVTISGADEEVDPNDLIKLSLQFPFVEWGILWSATRKGSARYPTENWMWQLARSVGRRPVRCAAHFCGLNARELRAGNDAWLLDMSPIFRRVQINGWEPMMHEPEHNDPLFDATGRHPDLEFVLQVRDVGHVHAAWMDAHTIKGYGGPKASLLFDPSGGRGVAPTEWPHAPSGIRMGFAGGITPESIESVVHALRMRPPFWLDMESGVRTDDRFDLEKVRAVLAAVAPHVVEMR